jgi:Zn-dependent protease
MHKAIAERYGITSEFKAFYGMLFFAVIFSFFGFIIAAPGAVEIKKRRLSKEEAGKISLAGPATNIAIGLVFLTLFFIFMPSGLLRTVFIMGLTINALLAVFNLIPFAMFDGKKVYRWNRTVYYVTLGFSLALLSSIFLV